MGPPVLLFAETQVFIQHYHNQLWISYQTTEVTKKGHPALPSSYLRRAGLREAGLGLGIGKVEEKKAIAMEEGHMDDCFTFTKAVEEESKAARVVRKCSSVITRFLQGIDALQSDGSDSIYWTRVDLAEVTRPSSPASSSKRGVG